jgi:hypothetical protein
MPYLYAPIDAWKHANKIFIAEGIANRFLFIDKKISKLLRKSLFGSLEKFLIV